MTIPAIGAICATTIEAFAPMTFSKGRDFCGLDWSHVKQNSSGGKDRLGKISRMSRRDLRRLLCWFDRRCAMGKTLWIASRIMAGDNAAYRLDLDGSRWRLPSSSVWSCLTQAERRRECGKI